MKKISIIAFIITFLDQIIKISLLNFIDFGYSISIIKNFFSITLIGNTGGAFSIMSSNTLFLIFISIFALFFIYFYLIKNQNLNNYNKITYGILIGGVLGNLIDRLWHMQVIDYLDFTIFNYNFPVFNLADIAIVISIFLIGFDIIKGDKSENKS